MTPEARAARQARAAARVTEMQRRWRYTQRREARALDRYTDALDWQQKIVQWDYDARQRAARAR